VFHAATGASNKIFSELREGLFLDVLGNVPRLADRLVPKQDPHKRHPWIRGFRERRQKRTPPTSPAISNSISVPISSGRRYHRRFDVSFPSVSLLPQVFDRGCVPAISFLPQELNFRCLNDRRHPS
jgi:hypothetical protein